MYEYIVFFCVLCVFYFSHKFRTDKRKLIYDSSNDFSSCINPNCVRCVQYRKVVVRACERYKQLCKLQTELVDSTQRIEKSLHINSKHNSSGNMSDDRGSNPLVFDLKDINSHEFYSPDSCEKLADDVEILERGKETIFSDFQAVNKPKYQHLWLKNDTPNGNWRVFHLINQGKVVENNVAACERTFAMISSLKNVMNRNVFGNVLFSVVNPGTTISTHYGPTNIRIRCHLGLVTVDKCTLTVSRLNRKWEKGKCLLFDDSFAHGVQHNGGEEDGSRCVFIVDLWHPDITPEERSAINYIFSPVKTSSTSV